jgi:hypothetical protein
MLLHRKIQLKYKLEASTLMSTLCTPCFSGVHAARSSVFYVIFVDRFLFFFFWPLYCLSFDSRILITPLVSSNFLLLWNQ